MNTVFWSVFAIIGLLSDWFVPIAVFAVVGSFIAMVARTSRSKPSPAVSGTPVVLEKIREAPVLAVSNSNIPSAQTLAMIAAVVRVTLGASARVAHVIPAQTAPLPSVDIPSPHWSMEGRRQIYSSHQIR
jgi:hypothetical protein